MRRRSVNSVLEECIKRSILSSYKAYYSAPCRWVGSTVKVVTTRSLVKIYAKGECVATHLRDDSRRWIYGEKYFPKNAQNWRGRNRQWFVERGHNILWALGKYNYQILSDLINRIKAGTGVFTPIEKLSPPVAHEGVRGAQAYQ